MNKFHRIYGDDSADVGEMITALSQLKIIFGHQSVGNNILAGIRYWEEESGVKFNRLTSRDPESQDHGVFIDFAVGSNGNPVSKIDDFIAVVEDLPGGSEAMAFFKLCYVDITAGTDVEELFGYYREKMIYLKEKKPGISVALFTVPVTSVQGGWKAMVKKAVGRVPAGVLNNMKRSEFNNRLMDELSGVFPVFDLAGVETTLPDGKKNIFEHEGIKYPSLPEIYTSDGGHLNSQGSRMVAYNLLAFLAHEIK